MNKSSSLSIFTRLYITIAMAMIVSGATSIFFIEKTHQQGVIDEYVSFTQNIIYPDLIEEDVIERLSLQDIGRPANNVDGYLISWLVVQPGVKPCSECKYVGQSNDVEVYKNDIKQFYAVQKLAHIKANLVIFENNIFYNEDEEANETTSILDDFSFHEIEELTLLLVVFTSVAVSIYWPIRVIQRQIENLIKVQHKFGAGDLATRANYPFTDPISVLAVSFDSMASAISDTVNENQVFAQAVPHEVRTPLSKIQLVVGLLRQNNVDNRQLELLGNIDNYIDDMSVLIDQVVSFSKLNSAANENELSLYHKLDLATFIESRVDATKCNEKLHVVLHLDYSLAIVTNPAYLRLLLDNLLNNARNYAKSKITISLQQMQQEIHLIVQDDGNGVSPEFLENIFIPFSRHDVSRSRVTGGLGLGLAIAKAASKRMNSELSVKNAVTSGAIFTCKFLI